jgi:hypothetical protein
MAGDQRYCVECGTRRGKPRFELAAGPSRPSAAIASAPARSVTPRAIALLAVLVVLVAFGVGVLIGNSGGSSQIKGPITVVLSGSGATGGGSGAGKSATKATSGAKSTPPKTSTTSNFFGSGG